MFLHLMEKDNHQNCPKTCISDLMHHSGTHLDEKFTLYLLTIQMMEQASEFYLKIGCMFCWQRQVPSTN